MCGRYSLTTEQEALAIALGVEGLVHPEPRYNIAPTQRAPILRAEGDSLHAEVRRWGLIPSWSDGGATGAPLINARSESAHRKPSFREPFRRGRCLVPADGFFEWVAREGGKTPYWIHRRDREPFTFAGLLDEWRSPEGDVVESFTILTTEADEPLHAIHHRMPVVVDAARRFDWLDPEAPVDDLRALLAEARSGDPEVTRVSTRVNSPAHDDPSCITPAEGADPTGTVEQTTLF